MSGCLFVMLASNGESSPVRVSASISVFSMMLSNSVQGAVLYVTDSVSQPSFCVSQAPELKIDLLHRESHWSKWNVVFSLSQSHNKILFVRAKSKTFFTGKNAVFKTKHKTPLSPTMRCSSWWMAHFLLGNIYSAVCLSYCRNHLDHHFVK